MAAERPWSAMRQLGIAGAVIVGYSDGGISGLDIAIHHPEWVSKLAHTGVNARFDGYAEADPHEPGYGALPE